MQNVVFVENKRTPQTMSANKRWNPSLIDVFVQQLKYKLDSTQNDKKSRKRNKKVID